MSSTRADDVSIHAVSPELISALAVSGSRTITNRANIVFNTGHPLFAPPRCDASTTWPVFLPGLQHKARQARRQLAGSGNSEAVISTNSRRSGPAEGPGEAPLLVSRLARQLLLKPHAWTEAWNDKRNPRGPLRRRRPWFGSPFMRRHPDHPARSGIDGWGALLPLSPPARPRKPPHTTAAGRVLDHVHRHGFTVLVRECL